MVYFILFTGEPCALITTNTNNKIYSNGLDLEQANKYGHIYFKEYMNLLERMLTFPIPTIAGIIIII